MVTPSVTRQGVGRRSVGSKTLMELEVQVGDLIYMQDEIVARLAGALNAELLAAEAGRAEKNRPLTQWTSISRVWLCLIRLRPRTT